MQAELLVYAADAARLREYADRHRLADAPTALRHLLNNHEGAVEDRVVEAVIDVWAHDYANDAWCALSAEQQMAVGRRIAAAARGQ